jgi:hypothetical protein
MLGTWLSRFVHFVMGYMTDTPRSKYDGLGVSKRWLRNYAQRRTYESE